MAWAFVVVQLILLAAVFLLPTGTAWDAPAWLRLGARILMTVGLAVVVIGLVQLGRSATPLPTPAERGELRVDGLYRWARHPIYTGLMALVIGSAIPSGSVLVAGAAAALMGWLVLKAKWEERRLADRYPGYAAYAARTARFVPRWRGGR
jgi:protein-S-isoprenylcysteine O-methyltransferase Ste14